MFLLYINAVFALLFGAFFLPFVLLVFAIAGGVAAGFGIANERRWGYILGVVVAVLSLLPFAYVAVADGPGKLLNIGVLFDLVFPVVQFAALIHPESREYQKVWFR